MTLRMVLVALALGGLLAGCGRSYWQGKGGGLFMDDSAQRIEEAKGKYDIYSQDIYRASMRARDWKRV